MKKPDKIYVHTGAHLGMLTLTTIPVGVTDEQEYIRKDVLLEWAEHMNGIYPAGAFQMMIDKLNSM